MSSRSRLIILLIAAGGLIPALLISQRSNGSPSAQQRAAQQKIPRDALAALEQGRFFRASRLLHQYLEESRDSTPEVLLATARADAGWENWRGVRQILADRAWLETLDGGLGLSLLGRAELALGDAAAAERTLARYVDQGRGTKRELGSATFRRGQAMSRVTPADALPLYETAARDLPEISDWIRIHAARAAAAAADTAATRTQLSRTDAAIALSFGWRAHFDALQKAGAISDAVRVGERAAATLPTQSRQAEAWSAVGILLLQQGDTAKAREALRRAVAEPISSAHAKEAAKLLLALKPTDNDRLNAGRVLLRNGDTDAGANAVRAYLARNAAPAVRLELGRSLFSAAKYTDAIRTLEPIARSSAPAMHLIGRSQYRGGQQAAARATFQRVAATFPKAPAASEALFTLGDLAQDDADLATARTFFTRAVAASPSPSGAALARMRLGEMAFTRNNYAEALRIFEAYRANARGSALAQASYWAGNAHHELGDSALARQRWREARRADPMSYYASTAARRLGENTWGVPLEPNPAVVALPADAQQTLERIALLRELELNDAAAFEVSRLRQRVRGADALYTLAEALNGLGFTTDGISIGHELRRARPAWNLRLLRIIYPLPYRENLFAEARERGVDPYLVAGLIRQESMYKANAISPVGAVGLMQVMPGTGSTLARGAGVARFDKGMLEHPEVNLHLGISFAADLLKQYDGRLPLVLSAYNAGPTRADRWKSFPEAKSDELFTERIPFEETRDYVRIVQNNARIYEAVYPPAAATD
jgi:soluble lytic murein transglycosylase